MTVTHSRKTPGGTAGSTGRSVTKQVTERSGLYVTLPALGSINLGPPDQLVYLAGIATLTALEIIEWPIALVIAAGHLLAEQRRSNTMHAFGEALEQA
jgi:hypothetical protein